MIKTVIIDDEQLARDIIRTFLESDPEIEIVQECDNGFEGLKAINEHQPDLVFLDIMMPKITGFEMLELLENAPVVVFSTAYDEFAIKAFDMNAVDYLLKPYTKERFAEALGKAKSRIAGSEQQAEKHDQLIEAVIDQKKLDRIVVKTGNRIHIIDVEHVHYLEAMDDYVEVHTKDGKYLKQATMKYFEGALNSDRFVRIHRSYLVAVDEIQKIEPMGKDTHVCITKTGQQLGVSRSGYSRLKSVLNF